MSGTKDNLKYFWLEKRSSVFCSNQLKSSPWLNVLSLIEILRLNSVICKKYQKNKIKSPELEEGGQKQRANSCNAQKYIFFSEDICSPGLKQTWQLSCSRHYHAAWNGVELLRAFLLPPNPSDTFLAIEYVSMTTPIICICLQTCHHYYNRCEKWSPDSSPDTESILPRLPLPTLFIMAVTTVVTL